MPAISELLADHRFAELFIDVLGWERSSGDTEFEIDGRRFSVQTVAHKRGLQILHCRTNRRILFNRGLLRAAQRRIARAVHEHIIIYTSQSPPKQVWQWAITAPGGTRLRHREHPFFSSAPPEALLVRLESIRFSLDEEEDITIVDALHRVRSAFDVSPELNLFARSPSHAERSDRLATAMAQGDKAAFDQLILLHRPLASRLSKRLLRVYGLGADDAEQIAVIGLMHAARRFDPERGYQFSTHAFQWIRKACLSLGPRAALMINLPDHVLRRLFPIRRRSERLERAHGPERAQDELSRLRYGDDKFSEAWREFERALNIESLSDPNEDAYHESLAIPAPQEDEAIELILQRERRECVLSALSKLTTSYQQLLRLRYGIGCDETTLEEVSLEQGCTRKRIRRIQLSAEESLRVFIRREMKDLIPETKHEPASEILMNPLPGDA